MSFKHLIILFLLLLSVFLIFATVSSVGIIAEFSNHITLFFRQYSSLYPRMAVGLFIAFAAISVLFGPFTSVFLVPIAILLWGMIRTFIFLLTGWLIGGVLTYALGRFIGYPIVTKLVSKAQVDEWIDWISKEATFILAFLFRLALPAETGYVFGLVKYNFWKYMLIVFLVEFPIGLLIIFAGDAFLDQSGWKFASSAASALIIFGMAGYAIQRRRKIHSSA